MSVEKVIKEAFDPFLKVSIDVWSRFAESGELISAGKNEILKNASTVERYLSFIIRGSGGVFLANGANPVCIDICYKHEFFGDYMSFLTQEASPLEVITFEPCELFRISRSNFDKLNSDKICRFAAEALFIHKQQQQIDILTKSAELRYNELFSKSDNVRNTPQKYIASYLGITPQSLSRIRARYIQKKGKLK